LIHRQVGVNVRKAVVVFDAEQAVIISKIDPAKMYNMTFIHPCIVSRVSHAGEGWNFCRKVGPNFNYAAVTNAEYWLRRYAKYILE
jgi:hypothetical protein